MVFIYKIKGFELKNDFKLYLERELDTFLDKYHFIKNTDRIHVDIEINKELKCKTKIQFHIVKLGKIINSSDEDNNLYRSFNNIVKKLDKQLYKIKDKKHN